MKGCPWRWMIVYILCCIFLRLTTIRTVIIYCCGQTFTPAWIICSKKKAATTMHACDPYWQMNGPDIVHGCARFEHTRLVLVVRCPCALWLHDILPFRVGKVEIKRQEQLELKSISHHAGEHYERTVFPAVLLTASGKWQINNDRSPSCECQRRWQPQSSCLM